MWVESEGKGSTFHFTANFHIPPVCDLPSSLNVDRLKDIPVLVVDDNNTNRAILVNLLKVDPFYDPFYVTFCSYILCFVSILLIFFLLVSILVNSLLAFPTYSYSHKVPLGH